MLLKLKGDRKGSFKRNARDEAGAVVRRYEWQPGVTLEVDERDLTLVGDDILNGVLIPLEKDAGGTVAEVAVDREQLAEAIAEAHEEAHQRRLAFQAARQGEKDAKRKLRTKKPEPQSSAGKTKDSK